LLIMTWTTDMYRKTAVTLWGAISLAVGLSIGVYFELGDKKTLFVVVVTVGLYVMALLRWLKHEQDKKASTESYNPVVPNEMHSLGDNDKPVAPTMSTHKDEKKLSDEETREWLDDFLVDQQDK